MTKKDLIYLKYFSQYYDFVITFVITCPLQHIHKTTYNTHTSMLVSLPQVNFLNSIHTMFKYK